MGTLLCAMVLASLLFIGGVELNPGPVDNTVQALCSGCDRTHVAGGITTAVVTSRSTLLRVENGTSTDVDRRDFEC